MGGSFSPALAWSLGFGVPLAILVSRGQALLSGAPHLPCVVRSPGPGGAAGWGMEPSDICTVLILLFGFSFLGSCLAHNPFLPPTNSSFIKVFMKTFASVHTNYIRDISSCQDFDVPRAFKQIKGAGVFFSTNRLSLFPTPLPGEVHSSFRAQWAKTEQSN